VYPDDERYKALIGKKVKHPLLDRTFPIIGDAELVDPKFGTGAVKVTPAHSFEDFEAGKRNWLQFINILNLDGTLNENAGPFQGQDRIAARPAIKAALSLVWSAAASRTTWRWGAASDAKASWSRCSASSGS
jgi:valyl-tRNA synthetase